MGSSPLLDKIASSPLTFLGGCVAFIPAAIWMISLCQWMISGDVDVLAGLAGMGGVVALLILAVFPPAPWVPPLVVLMMILLVPIYPFVRQAMNQRELRRMDLESFEKKLSALIANPTLSITRFEIGEFLVKQGFFGNAIALCEPILSAPIRSMDNEKRVIKGWMAYARPDQLEPIRCSSCGVQPLPSAIICPNCQAAYLIHELRGGLLGTGRLGRQLILTWALASVLLLTIPLAGAFLDPRLVPLTVLGMLAAGGFVAWRTLSTRDLTRT